MATEVVVNEATDVEASRKSASGICSRYLDAFFGLVGGFLADFAVRSVSTAFFDETELVDGSSAGVLANIRPGTTFNLFSLDGFVELLDAGRRLMSGFGAIADFALVLERLVERLADCERAGKASDQSGEGKVVSRVVYATTELINRFKINAIVTKQMNTIRMWKKKLKMRRVLGQICLTLSLRTWRISKRRFFPAVTPRAD